MWHLLRFQEVCVLTHTAVPQGYTQCCAPAGPMNDKVIQELQQTHTEAMTNLATATATDRQDVRAFTQKNDQSMLQLQTLI